MSDFTKLEAKLLAFGGERVLPMPEPQASFLLRVGRPFPVAGRRRLPGAARYGPRHVALCYARHHAAGLDGPCAIVTGSALTKHGLWVPHHWVWQGNVVDATAFRNYFGVQLAAAEAADFVMRKLRRRCLERTTTAFSVLPAPGTSPSPRGTGPPYRDRSTQYGRRPEPGRGQAAMAPWSY